MSLNDKAACVCCRYRRCWEDGYGARGWKLTAATDDPEVIAATAETGSRIPTSVFVHDILDHRLCGLGASGHRNEAIALVQLGTRTGTDPTPDFAQMVDEDLMQGRVSGESLMAFLPPDLGGLLPSTVRGPEAVIAWLRGRLGAQVLRQRLIDWLSELGARGAVGARERYESHGLDYDQRGSLGLALQTLFAAADSVALARNWLSASAEVRVDRERCGLRIFDPVLWSKELSYRDSRAP